jgi:hypothetical protein
MDSETLSKLKNSTDVMDKLKNRKPVKIEKPIESLDEKTIKKINKQIDERSL